MCEMNEIAVIYGIISVQFIKLISTDSKPHSKYTSDITKIFIECDDWRLFNFLL